MFYIPILDLIGKTKQTAPKGEYKTMVMTVYNRSSETTALSDTKGKGRQKELKKAAGDRGDYSMSKPDQVH